LNAVESRSIRFAKGEFFSFLNTDGEVIGVYNPDGTVSEFFDVSLAV
jgi:hypothetical protein